MFVGFFSTATSTLPYTTVSIIEKKKMKDKLGGKKFARWWLILPRATSSQLLI